MDDKMMMIDFTKINVEVEIGKFETHDISKPLGNYIHQMTDDIGMDDIAHDIYRNGYAEITAEQAEIIKGWVKQSNIAPFIRLALVRHIDKGINEIKSE